MPELKANIAYLAKYLLQTSSGLKWTVDFFTASQARVVTGITNESDESVICRDYMMDSISRGLPRPYPDLTTNEWETLFIHVKTDLDLSDESVMWEIRANEASRAPIRQEFMPKPPSDVLSSKKIDLVLRSYVSMNLVLLFIVSASRTYLIL